MNVYIVQHEHNFDKWDEDVKVIGIYASREDAENAVASLREKPGFNQCQDGFCIGEYALNKDHWTEGFVSITNE